MICAKNGTVSNQIVSRSVQAVRGRLRLRNVIEAGAWGGLCGAAMILIGVFWFENGIVASFPLLLVGPIFGALIGVVAGFFFPMDPHEPARRIDVHYQLKDRTLTALAILARNQTTPMERLQLEDAAFYAEAVDPSVVVPYRWPRPLYGMVLLILLTPLTAGQLRKHLENTSSDRKESLAVLSERERDIRSLLENMRSDAVDQSLAELGDAFGIAERMRPIAAALRVRDYSKAADQLDELGTNLAGALSRQEREAVTEQMRLAQQGMERRGQSTLLEATKKTGEAIRQGDEEHYRQGASALAAEFREQAVRKEIERDLRGKLAAIEFAKVEIAATAQGENEGNGNGGSNTKKSDTPCKNWGTGTAGAPAVGSETHLEAVRQRESITGMIGTSGESEFRKTKNTDPSRIDSVERDYQERYDTIRKTVETVVDSEQIPIGQRWMIRNYFRTIRSGAEGQDD